MTDRDRAQAALLIDWIRSTYDRLLMQNSIAPTTRGMQRLAKMKADLQKWEKKA